MVCWVREAARLLGMVVAVKEEGESVSSYTPMWQEWFGMR